MATSTLGMYLEYETESAQAGRADGDSSGLLHAKLDLASEFVLESFELPFVFASLEVEAIDSSGATIDSSGAMLSAFSP